MPAHRVLSLCNKVFSVRRNLICTTELVSRFQKINLNHERHFRKPKVLIPKFMKTWREVAGPDKLRKRSDMMEWNYNGELYAFNKRLHENISEDVLRCIFIHDSYIRMEEEKRKNMDIQDVQLDLKCNTDLIKHGEEIMNRFIIRFLRHCYPLVPEEGIHAVHNYLTSDDILSHVSSSIGTKDLIFCAEYPPSNKTLAATFKAIIGGIASSESVQKAEVFVLDFVFPQLIGKNVFELWNFDKPLQILNDILLKEGRKPTESRLIFESGRNTIEAIYHVGLYSNKEFLGRGPGETLIFAEKMAAYDALRRIFRLRESDNPLPFGEEAKKIVEIWKET